MSVVNLQNIDADVWIPPSVQGAWKITITRLNGTVDDVTDILQSWMFEDQATTGIGDFSLTIPNPNETYNGVYTGMEVVRLYADYAATPTTLRFRGRVEKPSNMNNTLRITGRTESLFVLEQSVTKVYNNADIGYIIKDLFTTYGGGRFDTSQINVSTGIVISTAYTQSPFWDTIKGLCTGNGYDCYIDCNLVVQFYLIGTVTNQTDAIIHDSNLIEVGDFAPDTSYVKTKVVVYGAQNGNLQPIGTANASPAIQTLYGVRVLNIQDNNATTDAIAQAEADDQLAYNLTPPVIGDVKSFFLPGAQPAQNIQLSAPYDNLAPNYYQGIKYKHEYDNDSGGPFTTITINREARTISHAARDLFAAGAAAQQTSLNPYAMDYTYGINFLTNTGTHTNTQITSGVLKLQTGQTSGTWISDVKVLTGTLNQVYVLIDGQTLTGVTLGISGDGGNNYDTITPKSLFSVVSVGGNLKIRVTFSDSTTQLTSINIMYSQT